MTPPAKLLRGAVAAAAVAIAAGCQERLTAPAQCPAQCPGSAEVFDTTLSAVPDADSSYQGYVEGGSGIALLVSNGLPGIADNLAVYRFGERPDSIQAGGNTVAYVVDSALISINLLARDTLLNGLKVYVYRIANTVQAGVTFPEVEAQLVEANVIDSVLVADTLSTGAVQIVLRGAEVLKTGLPVDAGGTLAIGVAIAPAGTGIRIGSTGGGTGATFASYVTAQNVADTVSDRRQTLNRTPAFNTYVSETTLPPDPGLLTVGGAPSSRALLRFDLPERLEDSSNIVRATLELVPSGPIPGLATDPTLLLAKGVLGDLGAKSPTVEDSDPTFVGSDTLEPGLSDTVRVDVTNIVRLWQSATTERPEAIFLKLLPEASTFMRPEFGSTRRPDIGVPRLRITYMLAFPFETP
ncbi:MAG TPA: hypothetical protein VEB59_00365 [Gemmatimonadales bacterium]|nr:hypothetical protein [Gemmatimonadales bacterium]